MARANHQLAPDVGGSARSFACRDHTRGRDRSARGSRWGQWWRWDEILGVSSGVAESGGRARQPTLPALLDPLLLHPARLIATLRLQPVGTTSRAGRAAILVRGVPRESAAGRSQLAYELELDAEHGTVLRRAAFDSGRRFQDSRVVHVVYDPAGRVDNPAALETDLAGLEAGLTTTVIVAPSVTPATALA